MDQLRVKSGCIPLDILAIGETTVRRVSAFSSFKMETNMKECGARTSDTARELTGVSRPANSVVSTPGTGLKTESTVVELSSTRVEIDTTGIGSTACPRARAA